MSKKYTIQSLVGLHLVGWSLLLYGTFFGSNRLAVPEWLLSFGWTMGIISLASSTAFIIRLLKTKDSKNV